MRSGGAAATRAWTWLWTSTQVHFPSPWLHATSAIVLGDQKCHLESAFVVTTGAARITWLPPCVCLRCTQCADTTHRWRTGPPTSSTFRDTGPSNPGHRILWGSRACELEGAWVTGKETLYLADVAWVTGLHGDRQSCFFCFGAFALDKIAAIAIQAPS
eukprot:5341222-Amphidinium_carterae.1